MSKSTFLFIGLFCAVALISGISFSQSSLDSPGTRAADFRTLPLGSGGERGEVTAVKVEPWISPDYRFDWGLGWLDREDTSSEQDLFCSSEKYVEEYTRYLGRAKLNGLAETTKQAILIDLKAPISLFDVVGLNVDQKSNGYLIRIHCTKLLPNFESWLKPIGNDTWLYITLADAQADVALLQDFKPTLFVKRILVFQSETSVQLTFMFKGQVSSAKLIPVEGSRDILVLLFTSKEEQLAVRKGR